jgi:diketogulonate reductase-like aldo/keto reductase
LVDREGHRASTPAALLQGLDLGDTAQLYGGGAAEELVGEAIAGRRNQVFLASKILPESASRSGARLVCAQSLACLDTDRLDCCLLSWRHYPFEETVAGFDDLRRAGKILSWDASNFDGPIREEG